MATPELHLFTTLVRYETRLWNHLDARLRADGHASLATLMTLGVVARHEGTCRVQEIRHEIGITVGAASKVVDRLEREGHVVRAPHPRDRRSSLILLTHTGTESHRTGTAALGEMLAEHLAGERGLEQMGSLLARLASRLDDDLG